LCWSTAEIDERGKGGSGGVAPAAGRCGELAHAVEKSAAHTTMLLLQIMPQPFRAFLLHSESFRPISVRSLIKSPSDVAESFQKDEEVRSQAEFSLDVTTA